MNKSSPLQIAFLDVGHGDTIVISTVESNIKRAIIIDCNDPLKTKDYILKNNIEVIDYIIITHMHTDHYSGVNSLIDLLIRNNIEVKNVCWEKDKCVRTDEDQKSKYKLFTQRLLALHANPGINYVAKRFDGQNFRRLDNGIIKDLKAHIIYPNSYIANYFDDISVNNTSAVIQIEYRNFRIILPGDLEGEGWHMLSKYMKNLKCDILKIPHHGGYFKGSNTAMSLSHVINYANPKFAIISTGENKKYNHPSKETIEYLSEKNVTIICTEVTNLCDSDRLIKKQCIMDDLGVNGCRNKNGCPCAGDIIFEIGDEIKVISQEYTTLNKVRGNFTNRLCTNL